MTTTTVSHLLSVLTLLVLFCACVLAFPAREPSEADLLEEEAYNGLQDWEEAAKRGGRMPIAAPMWFHTGKRQGPIAAPLWFHNSGRGKKSPPVWYLRPVANGPVKRSTDHLTRDNDVMEGFGGNH